MNAYPSQKAFSRVAPEGMEKESKGGRKEQTEGLSWEGRGIGGIREGRGEDLRGDGWD